MATEIIMHNERSATIEEADNGFILRTWGSRNENGTRIAPDIASATALVTEFFAQPKQVDPAAGTNSTAGLTING